VTEAYSKAKVYVTQETQGTIVVSHNLVIDEARGKARIVSYPTISGTIIADIEANASDVLSIAAIIAQAPENVTLTYFETRKAFFLSKRACWRFYFQSLHYWFFWELSLLSQSLYEIRNHLLLTIRSS
jgi:hypothetical protein